MRPPPRLWSEMQRTCPQRRSLCRHHRPRKRSDRSLPIESAPFVLPVFEDSRGLLRAVTDVLNAMSERRIKRSEGGTFLFGLQIASRLISDLAIGNCPPIGACFDSPSDLRKAAEEEFSREPRQESFAGDPQNFHEPTIEEAEQFLATMQSSTVERALDEWEAKQRARAREREHRPPGREQRRWSNKGGSRSLQAPSTGGSRWLQPSETPRTPEDIAQPRPIPKQVPTLAQQGWAQRLQTSVQPLPHNLCAMYYVHTFTG